MLGFKLQLCPSDLQDSTSFFVKDRRDNGCLQDMPQNPHPTPPGVPGWAVRHRPLQPQFSQPGGQFLEWQDITALLLFPAMPGRMAKSTAAVRKPTPVSPDRSSSSDHLWLLEEGFPFINSIQRLFGSFLSWCNEAGCLFFSTKGHSPRIWTNFLEESVKIGKIDPCYLTI